MPPMPPRTAGERLRDALANPVARTALLWLFLIVMFVVFFRLFQGSRPAPAGAEGAPGSEGGAPSPLALAATVLLSLAVGGALYWRVRSFANANKRAVDLMTAGDPAAAAEAFRRLARAPLAPVGVARFNLGLALLRLGDLRGALDALAAADRSRATALRPTIASLVALCNAVSGDLDAADRWGVEARRRTSSPASTSRVHLAAEAIVRLRRGDARGAARLLEEGWGDLERSTSADLVRAFRVVRAFAAEQAGAGAPASADLLAGARPFRPGEYGWLAGGWPEMGRYLAANGLGPSA